MRHYIIQGTTRTIELYTPQGQPDSDGTVNIYASGAALLSGWTEDTTAPRSTYSQSLTASASHGESSVYVVTTGLKRGDRLLLTNAYGLQEEVQVEGVGTNALALVDPLRYSHTTSSTLVCPRLSVALSSTHTETRRRWCRVVWSYEVDGVEYRHEERLDIVRVDYRAASQVTEHDLEREWPAFGRHFASSEYWRRAAMGAADLVEAELESQSVEPDLLKDPSHFKRLVALKTIERLHGAMPQIDPESLTYWQGEYQRALSRVLASPTWVDRDDDNVIGDGSNGAMDEQLGLSGGRRFKLG